MNRYDRDYPQHLQDDRRDLRDAFQDDLPLRQPAASTLPAGRDRDREYTLSTGIVLGVFFALALICAVFFGFGYTLGRKSMQPTAAADGTAADGAADPSTFSKFKPAAGSTSGASSAAPTSSLSTAPAATPAASVAPPAEAPAPRSTNGPQPTANAPQTTTGATTTKPQIPAPVVREATPAPSAAAPVPTGGTVMVQIAAVSHPEDAEVLTAALKRRGYAVVARSDGNDRLIHVQVGPFPSRKDAETMRQKLISDGYNAIIK